MNELVSQSEFARMKGVSRKTVSEWKTEKRLVFSGKLVDVIATQEKLLQQSSHRAKGRRRFVAVAGVAARGVTPSSVARYEGDIEYDNPANLPDVVVDASTAISAGAENMAHLLARHLSMELVRSLTAEWVALQRRGLVGGPGLPWTTADEEWPAPPIGMTHWCEHKLFQGDPIASGEWAEIEADHAAGTLQKVTA